MDGGKQHEADHWISISDLMAGVSAVIVLLFVLASVIGTLRAAQANANAQREADRRTAMESGLVSVRAAQRRQVDELFDVMAVQVRALAVEDDVELDKNARLIRLRDTTFSAGSACLRPGARAVLAEWARRSFRPFLVRRPEAQLAVEGHTDSSEVRLDRQTFAFRAGHRRNLRCALFDDNITLSAARAREARSGIVTASNSERWPDELAARVNVAGLGSSRPRQGIPPTAPAQRRVEIRVIVPEETPLTESSTAE